jgi:hypothetical protein
MTTNSNNSGNQEDRETSEEDVETDRAEAVTDGGQPLALEERLDTGSKSWDEVQKDKHQYDFQPTFPACSKARTTFYAREAWQTERYERFFVLHHGRGHTYEGWDGQRVRQEHVFTHRRASVILSQAESERLVKEQARSRVIREPLQGFSRFYEGIDGAALGFATLYKYDDVEEAKDSYLADVAEEMLGVDGEKLVEYVWDKYGGESR